jgi:vancomycin resistance protein VanJ
MMVGLFVLWLAALILLLVCFRWVGEANPFTAFLLFVPTTVWWLPGLLMWPMMMIFRWRPGLGLGIAGFWVVALCLGWEWRRIPPVSSHNPGRRPPEALVILTNNRGQHGGHSLRPFKNHIQPDMMVFQESSADVESYRRDSGYAEFQHGLTQGEFTLISRFPVTQVEPLVFHDTLGVVPYAARFEMDWLGRMVAVYVVHFPSPRDPLLSMRRGSFLYGLPVPMKWWRQRQVGVSGFWRRQVAMAEHLIKHLETETLPHVVAGDFNAPHLGHVHQLLSQSLSDAHDEAGSGFGFTFPGETRNPLTLGEPWLRIDHVFASSHWQFDACWTESGRRSQHRAVAAGLRLREE